MMRKVYKIFVCSILALVLAFGAAACGRTTPAEPKPEPQPPAPVDPIEETPTPPDLYELIDDEAIGGVRGEEIEMPRVPDDEEWEQLQLKSKPLAVGESHTETFDGNYYTSRLSPVNAKASYAITDEAGVAIDGKSLRITSGGNYNGVDLTGLKFVSGGSYKVSFRYKFISGNDFIVQFRAPNVSDGKSDVFTRFGPKNGQNEGTQTFTAHLKYYTGYYFMLMPGQSAVDIVIDDFKVERLNSRPIADGLHLDGALAIGETVTASYSFIDYEETDTEEGSQLRWYVALNTDGLNKMLLPEQSASLQITEAMRGKYVGFEVVPKSSSAENNVGDPKLFMSESTVGGSLPSFGAPFTLDIGDKFTEDFETDVGEERNLIYENAGGSDNCIFMDEDDSYKLRMNTTEAYTGANFTGIRWTANASYRIRMDYYFNVVPDAFYVQLRGSAGDVFNQPKTDIAVGEKARFDAVFTLKNADDYYLMMFNDASPMDVVIDNLEIERIENAQEKNSENFDYVKLANVAWAKTGNAVVERTETDLPVGGNGKGLRVAAETAGDGVAFEVGFEQDVKYTVTLDIKTVGYDGDVAAVSGDNRVTLALGDDRNGTVSFDITAGGDTLQLVGTQENAAFVLDNLRFAVWIDTSYPAYNLTEKTTPTALEKGATFADTFDKTAGINFDQDGATLATTTREDEAIDGRSLRYESSTPFGKIYLKNTVDFIDGETYTLAFDYRVVERGDTFYFKYFDATEITPDEVEFGGGTLGEVARFTYTFVANGGGKLFRLMKGNTNNNSVLIIDNVHITHVDDALYGFVDFESGTVGETFLSQGEATLEIVCNELRGKALKITGNGSHGYPGAFIALPKALEAGKTYTVTFDVKHIVGDGGLYVRAVDADGTEIMGTYDAVAGTITATVTASASGSNKLRIMASNNADAVYVIDNLRVSEAA